MKSKGFLGDWKSYTLRDKILLSSSITPLIVFVGSFFLMLLHIFTEGNHNISKLLHAESCGELVFKGYDFNVKGSDKDFCSVDLIYSIHPALILLSTISIGIYAFFSIKSDEEVSNIFLSKTSSIESSKSVLLMLQYVYTLSIIFLILFFSFFWMVGDGFYEYTIADEYNDYEIETSCYHHDPLTLICETGTYSWDFYGYAFKPDKVTVNPLSSLILTSVASTTQQIGDNGKCEIRWSGQSVVSGKHPNKDGDGQGFYDFLPGCSPDEIELAEAPQFFLEKWAEISKPPPRPEPTGYRVTKADLIDDLRRAKEYLFKYFHCKSLYNEFNSFLLHFFF